MRQQSKESIVILFISAALALNYPFLDLFDRVDRPSASRCSTSIFIWSGSSIIVLLIVVVERSEVREPERLNRAGTPPASAMEPPKPSD
jgi:hypothetical protein